MSVELSKDEISEFLQHLHIIPVSKGLTRDWLEKHAAGMSTRQLLEALIKARAIEASPSHHSGWKAAVDQVTIDTHV